MNEHGYTFEAACQLLREEDPSTGLVEMVDKLLGFSIVLGAATAALTIGPVAGAACLALLRPKNELSKVGSALKDKTFKWLKRESGHMDRLRRLEAAHTIVVYAAFFKTAGELLGAFEKLLPEGTFTSDLPVMATIRELFPNCEPTPRQISVPHPAVERIDFEGEVAELFSNLTDALQRALFGAMGDLPAPESDPWELLQSLFEFELPKAAMAEYQGQYLQLMSDYPEFALWSGMHERQSLQVRLDGLFRLVGDSLPHLKELQSSSAARVALNELAIHYRNALKRSVLRTVGEAGEETGLEQFVNVPDLATAFVPQAFQVLRHIDGESLESDATWLDTPVLSGATDLMSWLDRWLENPRSLESPLLVLGTAGSGKSLLTRILAARLAGSDLTPIRVELRNVDATRGVASQIEQQVRRDVEDAVLWGPLRRVAAPKGFLILLDGYDELLQVGGEAHRHFPEVVQRFQREQAEDKGVPVRCIVTSRPALIDRCSVPHGASVIRLLPFDRIRRDRWTEAWNTANRDLFSERSIEPFQVPESDHKLVELAEHPLLLLMLALYDASENELANSTGLDRPTLYNRLIRRFVRRELKKPDGPETDTIEEMEQRQLDRLSIAALGMFQRNTLSITTAELDRDLEFFDLMNSTADTSESGSAGGTHLLRSFFFMHESQVSQQDGSRASESHAYEFLHKTFQEFLFANWLCQMVVEEAGTVESAAKGGRRRRAIDPLEVLWAQKDWHATLGYAPMFHEVEALALARTWLPTVAARAGLDCKQVGKTMRKIASDQLNRYATGRDWPSLFRNDSRPSFVGPPLLGSVANATLNLVVLGVVFGDGDWKLQAGGSSETTAKVWQRVTHIWRAWLSLAELAGLSRVVRSNVAKEEVLLQPIEVLQPWRKADDLRTAHAAASALGDSLLRGLCATLMGADGAERGARAREAFDALPTIPSVARLRIGLEGARHRMEDRSEWVDDLRPLLTAVQPLTMLAALRAIRGSLPAGELVQEHLYSLTDSRKQTPGYHQLDAQAVLDVWALARTRSVHPGFVHDLASRIREYPSLNRTQLAEEALELLVAAAKFEEALEFFDEGDFRGPDPYHQTARISIPSDQYAESIGLRPNDRPFLSERYPMAGHSAIAGLSRPSFWRTLPENAVPGVLQSAIRSDPAAVPLEILVLLVEQEVRRGTGHKMLDFSIRSLLGMGRLQSLSMGQLLRLQQALSLLLKNVPEVVDALEEAAEALYRATARG